MSSLTGNENLKIGAQILVRFSHLFAANESAFYSQPVTIDIRALFKNIKGVVFWFVVFKWCVKLLYVLHFFEMCKLITQTLQQPTT